jgi:hypothetical protein
MSTLDELRRTMDRRADEIHDEAVHVRAAAVRRRGRQVRRQRRVGAGIATLAAAATVVAVVALPGGRSPQPADRRLLGMEAPATMTSLGYTYAFSRGIEGDATRTTVKLPASDSARLLTWADRGVATIRVRAADGRRIVSTGDFRDFVTIPPGTSGTWTITGTATAAAVYRLDPSLAPDGVTKAGITYRSNVLDRTLLQADIGEAGQADLQGSVNLPGGRVGVSGFCTGGTKKTWIHFDVANGVKFFGASCSAPVFDPGGHLDSEFRSVDTNATVRVWATEGEHGPLSTSPDLRLGYGFYTLSHDTVSVAGYRLEQQVEHDGHVWGMPITVQSQPGDRSFEWIAPDRGTSLVVATFSHTRGPVYTSLAGVDGAAFSGTGLGGATTLGLSYPGDPASVLRIRGAGSPRALLGFAFYERLD